MMPDSIKILLLRIMMIVGAFLFYYFGSDYRYGALLVGGVIMTGLIMRTYDDWDTFLKRVMLSIPFIAMVELSLYILLRPDRFTYWFSAVLLFVALIINIPKPFLLSHYFTMVLVTGVLLSISLISKLPEIGIGFYTYGSLFISFFCASYLLIMNRNQKTYVPLLAKSFIAGLLITLFFWIFMISDNFMSQHEVSLAIEIGFYCFMGLLFFLIFYNLGKQYFKANDLFKKGDIF